MDENDFQKKLGDLMGEINTLPKAEREKLEQLAQQTKERHGKLKKTVGELQESLDYLRLSIKYLVFDLEATRRENGYLRKMLEDANQANQPKNPIDFSPEDLDLDVDLDDDQDELPGSL